MERSEAALIVVDMQNDFIPGVSISALPVAGADTLVQPINALMEDFDLVVATQDWHPKLHASFASTQGVKPFDLGELHGKQQVFWPDHCVAGSWGAQLEPFLKTERVSLILRKGSNRMVDSYSAFRENWGPGGTRNTTGLNAWLEAKGIRKVFICGVALDYCVRYTAEDSLDLGFKTYIFTSLTKSVNPNEDDKLYQELGEKGVGLVW